MTFGTKTEPDTQTIRRRRGVTRNIYKTILLDRYQTKEARDLQAHHRTGNLDLDGLKHSVKVNC